MARKASGVTNESKLYRQLKTSRGGVMLLVRLRVDLASLARRELRSLAKGKALTPPQGSRLASTCDWMTRQFGAANAARAICETASELVEALPARRRAVQAGLPQPPPIVAITAGISRGSGSGT